MEKKILIVDDDAMILRMAELILKKAGYEVVTVGSGGACLEMLKKEKVDLILLDVEMPYLSGLDTLKKIWDGHLAGEAPVYFLSGSEEAEEKAARGLIPADGFISKPFLPAELLSTVAAALGR